jgi:group I intron endonuclease
VNYSDCGYVYAIVNTVNGSKYIGSTLSPKSRWGTHKCLLRKGKHHSFILQKAWHKYGEAAFRFDVLLICAKNMRVFYESALIKLSRYNVMKTGVFKAVCGKKISLALLGKPKTAAHKSAISTGKTGTVMDESFRNKAKLRQLGVSPSAETRARLSESLKRARSPEADKSRELSLLVYAQYKIGESVSKLCEKHGVTTNTFYRNCVALGLPSVKQKAMDQAVAEIKIRLSQGATLAAACAELGFSPRAMSAVLLRRANHD